MSQIFLRQNDSKNIELLVVMRRTYSQVKFVNWVVSFLSVVISVAIVIFTIVVEKTGLFPHLTIAPYLGYYGVIVLVIMTIFSTTVSLMKKYVATIQGMLDRDALHIPWNELKVGKPVGKENVFKASRHYKKRDKNDELINWCLNEDYHASENILALLCHVKDLGWDKV